MSQIVPVLYAGCFLLLLVQSIRLMSRGFAAAGRRTGHAHGTVHPELLDAEGNLTGEPLLTVRFTDPREASAPASQESPGSHPED